MAERAWLLNDTLFGLPMEFEAAPAEGTWGFHDTRPLVLAMQFAAEAAPWAETFWNIWEEAFNGPEAGGGVLLLTRLLMGVGK